ncbi:hypothetical protein Tco_0820132 [Tanacetum coccineum]|uniref:Uncharacterized protein n=1 Tax=Tanacetum coccineum TaxID=301880 RepID=A0ABQ5ACI9_9ASTR
MPGSSNFLPSSIKEQVKKEVSKIIPKVEKLVTDQLESEVLVRSSKEANTSSSVAAKLQNLELKSLINKMEANNSINRSDIQRQLYKALVEAYEADKILLDTYGDTVTIKRPRDDADDDQEPSAGTDRGSKRRRSGKEPASTSAPSETTTKTAGKTTGTGSQTHKKSASQSAPVEEAMQSTYNLAQQDPRESFDELTDSTFDFSAFVLTGLNVQTLPLELQAVPISRSSWYTISTLPINNDMKDLRGGVSSRKNSTSVNEDFAADYGISKWIEDLVPNSMWSQTIIKYDKFALWGISHWGKKRRQFYAFATLRESARDVYSKRRIIAVTKVEIVEWHDYKHLDWILYEG